MKCPKSSTFFLAENILSLASDEPVVCEMFQKWWEIVFNYLTFQIEPFGDFEKNFLNLETKMVIWRRSHISRTGLLFFMKFAPVVVLNVFFPNPVTVWPEKIRLFFEKLLSLQKNTFSCIFNEPDFSWKNGRAQF